MHIYKERILSMSLKAQNHRRSLFGCIGRLLYLHISPYTGVLLSLATLVYLLSVFSYQNIFHLNY